MWEPPELVLPMIFTVPWVFSLGECQPRIHLIPCFANWGDTPQIVIIIDHLISIGSMNGWHHQWCQYLFLLIFHVWHVIDANGKNSNNDSTTQ
jgi:hypothetical protein